MDGRAGGRVERERGEIEQRALSERPTTTAQTMPESSASNQTHKKGAYDFDRQRFQATPVAIERLDLGALEQRQHVGRELDESVGPSVAALAEDLR